MGATVSLPERRPLVNLPQRHRVIALDDAEGDADILVFEYDDADAMAFHAARAGYFGRRCDDSPRNPFYVETVCTHLLRERFPRRAELVGRCRCAHAYVGSPRVYVEAWDDFAREQGAIADELAAYEAAAVHEAREEALRAHAFAHRHEHRRFGGSALMSGRW